MPLGAASAFYGIRKGMTILHGSQGCSTYIRRHMATHYNEPVDIASSSLTEEGTVLRRRQKPARRSGQPHQTLQPRSHRRGHHLPGRNHRRRRARHHQGIQGKPPGSHGPHHPRGLTGLRRIAVRRLFPCAARHCAPRAHEPRAQQLRQHYHRAPFRRGHPRPQGPAGCRRPGLHPLARPLPESGRRPRRNLQPPAPARHALSPHQPHGRGAHNPGAGPPLPGGIFPRARICAKPTASPSCASICP